MEKLDVIIYCGGKCGSSSLLDTFRKNGFNTIKAHNNLEYQMVHNDLFKKWTSVENLIYRDNEKLYIIDSYRDPIERIISSFFQNIESHTNLEYEIIKNIEIDKLIKIFNDNWLYILETYHPLDYELPIFLNEEFNFNKEYNIKKINNKIFIKLRFKKINSWEKILSEIFEKKINIINSNLSEEKKYNELYGLFKKQYKVPKDFLNKIITEDKLFRKYNTIEEQETYIKYWSLRAS